MSPRSAQAVDRSAAEAAVSDRRDAGPQAVERPQARDRLHVLQLDPQLALDVQADPVGETEPVSESGVDVVLEVCVGVDEAGEDHRLVVVLVAPELSTRSDVCDQSVVDRYGAVSNWRPLDRDHPVGGDDPHESSASAKSSSQPRFQRRSMKTESQMDISKRMSSGMVSNASETGSTVGRRIANMSSATYAIRRFERRRSGGQDAKAHEPEDEDRHEERQSAGEQRHRSKRVVVARADLNVVDVRVVRREEVERSGQDDRVHERHADDEERRGEDDEHEDDALEVRLNGGREERPRLPEHDRQGKCECGDHAHLHRGRERLGDTERHELLVVRKRPDEPLHDPLVKGEGEREQRDDRDDRDDQP